MCGTKLSQHELHGPTSGTTLSPHAPSRRISGIKLSQHTRNGPIWRNLRMQGEFCTEHEAEPGLATTALQVPLVRSAPAKPEGQAAVQASGWQG